MKNQKPNEQHDASFIDADGRKWRLQFGIGIIRDLKSGPLDFDFGGFQTGAAFEKLSADPILLGELIWKLVEAQAIEQDVEMEEFFTALTDIDAMQVALCEAVINFTPPARRESLTTIMQAIEKVIRDSSNAAAADVAKSAEETDWALEIQNRKPKTQTKRRTGRRSQR